MTQNDSWIFSKMAKMVYLDAISSLPKKLYWRLKEALSGCETDGMGSEMDL